MPTTTKIAGYFIRMNYLIKNLLDSNGFVSVSKILIKAYGLDEAVLVGDLISRYNYFEQRNMLQNDGGFFAPQKDIEYDAGLSTYRQNKALEKLKFITTSKRGLPAKLYLSLIHI